MGLSIEAFAFLEEFCLLLYELLEVLCKLNEHLFHIWRRSSLMEVFFNLTVDQFNVSLQFTNP